ncbi:MAG: magnesium transporter CorA family protein [Porticoccus sp.]|nr:magnesium transporter CorA family protein [Porticoccus sp.]
MIRAQLLSKDSIVTVGDQLLVDQWKQDKTSYLWLDIEGDLQGNEVELLLSMGCHKLAIKDAQRKRHPPKIEEFENDTFVLFRGLTHISDDMSLDPQQIGFFVGVNLLVTVHRGASLSINQYWTDSDIASLLKKPSLLLTKIIHYSAGRYLEAVLGFETVLNDAEEDLLGHNPDLAMRALVGYRSRLLNLRRVFNYHEKLFHTIVQNEIKLHSQDYDSELRHALRDVYDRCERLLSLSSMYYETCGDLIDGYISISSHRLNDTMRILTVITAIFVPLSFMVGLYGMNFDHMPELHWKYSYFVLLGVMGSTVTCLFLFFRHRKWL